MINKIQQNIRGFSILVLVAAIVYLYTVLPVSAAPFLTDPFNLVQPDGSSITVREIGDEYARGYVTADTGFSVIKQDDGYWHLIDEAGNAIPISGNTLIKQNYHKGIYLSQKDAVAIEKIRKENKYYLFGTTTSDPDHLNKIISVTGDVSFPVILIRFTDVTPSQYDNTTLEEHYFGTHPSTATGPGSIHDYFNEVSYGELNLVGDVYGWYNSTHDSEYYNYTRDKSKYRSLITEAVQLADDDIDFSQYDSNNDGYVDGLIVIISGLSPHGPSGLTSFQDEYLDTDDYYNGIDNMRIWSFFALAEMSRTDQGVLAQCGEPAHELAHVFSLPDIYDYNLSDYGGGNGGEDNWDLMDGGCWNNINNWGDCPAQLSAWEKACLGYVNINQTAYGQQQHIDDIMPIESYNTAYQLLDNPDGFEGRNMGNERGSGEYFLIENRQKIGFDQGLAGEGLLIWHVNEYNTITGNNDPLNKLLDLEEADGHINSSDTTDPWYAPVQTMFNSSSIPNSNLINGSPSGVLVIDISERPAYPYDPMSASFEYPQSGYSLVKAHDIPGSEDGDLTDYQVQFVVNRGIGIDTSRYIYLNGGSQNWPNDFRFTNANGEKLNYWIEWNDTESAIVWVKIDNIAESPATTRLYINYGRPDDLGESDGNTTFVVFDHFEGTSWNSSMWVQWDTGTATVNNSNLRLSASGQHMVIAHCTNSIPLTSYVIETKGKVITPSNYNGIKYRPGILFRQGASQGNSALGFDTYAYDQNAWTLFNYPQWTWYAQNSPASISPSDAYGGVFRLQITINGASAYTCREALRDKVITDTRGPSGTYFSLMAEKCTDDYDWVFVRKYTPHEPIQPTGLMGVKVVPSKPEIDVLIDQSRNRTPIVNNKTITPGDDQAINNLVFEN